MKLKKIYFHFNDVLCNSNHKKTKCTQHSCNELDFVRFYNFFQKKKLTEKLDEYKQQLNTFCNKSYLAEKTRDFLIMP